MASTETWKVEHSWEATTLDYLSPLWYVTQEGFETEAAAEEAAAAKRTEAFEAGNMVAYRVTRVPSDAERYAWEEQEAAFQRQYWADRAAAARAQEEAREQMFETYGRGRVVKVVKGRKVPVGTEGTVFWLGEDKFGNGYRVGFETPTGEKHFTALSNVEALEMVEV